MQNEIVKTAIIRQVSPGKWKVFSEKGKPLSKEYSSLEAAQKRLDQIEMFKHMKPKKKKSQEIRVLLLKEATEKEKKAVALRKLAKDFRLDGNDESAKLALIALAKETGNEGTQADMSYSHMMRQLRKKKDKKQLREFQKAFKEAFDQAIDEGMEDDAEAAALMEAMQKLEYKDSMPGGLADNKKPSDFDEKQLNVGIKVELEHTNDPEQAREIAMDHLTEDPKYYIHLKEVEGE